MTAHELSYEDKRKCEREVLASLFNKFNELSVEMGLSNLQNVHTPYFLCDEMIKKLEEYGGTLKNKTFAVFNFEFIDVLVNVFGVLKENITFFTDNDLKIGLVVNHYNGVNVMKKNFDKESLMEKNPWGGKTFDCVILNPPYKGSMHLNFLQKAIDLTTKEGHVLCIHPSTWLFMGNKEEKTQKIYHETKNKISQYNVNLTLFNANKAFNVCMFMPFCITSIHKVTKTNPVSVKNNIEDKTHTYNSIYDVNKFGDYDEYYSLLSKITCRAKLDNLEQHRLSVENGQDEEKHNFYVNLSVIRGNVSKNNDIDLFSDDFYTFIPRDTKPETTRTKTIYFGFETEVMAQNFIGYLKTKFARFALALIKCNSQLSRGEMMLTPYLDFNQEWDDIKLQKLFEINDKEWQFIDKYIPNYY